MQSQQKHGSNKSGNQNKEKKVRVTKSWIFRMSIKTNELHTILTKRKGAKAKIASIRKEGWDITIDSEENERTIRK